MGTTYCKEMLIKTSQISLSPENTSWQMSEQEILELIIPQLIYKLWECWVEIEIPALGQKYENEPCVIIFPFCGTYNYVTFWPKMCNRLKWKSGFFKCIVCTKAMR